MTDHEYTPNSYSKIRVRNRAHYDRETVFAILDTGFVAHVGFVIDERPMVIPMAYARCGETIYIHGAKAARIIKAPATTASVCLTVTHVDGVVVARSAFNHSMNYRSVVIHGHVRPVTEIEEKENALIAVTNHILPNRWDEVRPMTDKEFRATGVLALEIETASAKIRQGPPIDDPADYDLPYWAGVIPVVQTLGQAVDDGRLAEGTVTPDSLASAGRKFRHDSDPED